MVAGPEYQEKVAAIRLTRFGGAVEIALDRPRRMKLSPAVWTDTFLSRGSCRNILMDLLDGDAPGSGRTASWVIRATP